MCKVGKMLAKQEIKIINYITKIKEQKLHFLRYTLVEIISNNENLVINSEQYEKNIVLPIKYMNGTIYITFI